METILKKYSKLLLGLILIATGITITINADLGYAPWDVFHQGLGNIFNIKLGTANILVGVTIIIIGIIMGQRPGIGTLANMFLVGTFINILTSFEILPSFENVYIRILSLFLAMFLQGVGTYLYISAGFGAGPRDTLMVLLIDKTNKSLRFIRNSIEITILIVGYLLGGPVGLGTVILSLGLGYAIQFAFGLFSFDANKIVHRGWGDEVESIRSFFNKNRRG